MGDTDRAGVERGDTAVAVGRDDGAGQRRDSVAVHQAVYRSVRRGLVGLRRAYEIQADRRYEIQAD